MWSRSIRVIIAAVVMVIIVTVAFSAFGQVTPPFRQCPGIGADSSCGILLYIDSTGSLRVYTDTSQGPFDGSDDTLIGVQNDSDYTILSIPLSSPNQIFSFDGDGICAAATVNKPAGCPFGPTLYEGPGVSFSSISADLTSGIVNFSPGIEPKGTMNNTAFFSLEAPIPITTLCSAITGVPLLKQFWSPWSTDTYDHSYDTRGFPNATTTPISTSGRMELVLFPLGSEQPSSPVAPSYTINLTQNTNNLNGLRDAINALGAGLTATVLTSKRTGLYYLSMTPTTALLNSIELRQTAGVSTSNILVSIQNKGCYLTSAAMIINYQADRQNVPFLTTPRDLNNWLNLQPDGYIKGGLVNPAEVARYARNNGVHLYYHLTPPRRNDFTLDSYICNGDPIMLAVKNEGHFVVATAQTTVNGIDSYAINDPGHNCVDLSCYNNTYSSLRAYSMQQKALSGLYIYAHSPVELLVTDPNGRQTGFNVGTGTIVQNIPDSSYRTDSIEDAVDPTTMDPTPEVKSFEAGEPTSGNYLLQIIGTGTGPYSIDILAYDSTGALSQQQVTGSATPGVGTIYQVGYSSAAGSQVSVAPTNLHSVTVSVGDARGSVSPTTQMVSDGSTATFTIAPNQGYQFLSARSSLSCGRLSTPGAPWSNQIATMGPITGDCQVTLYFRGWDVQVNITKDGTGSGTVTSDPAGIDCGSTCSQLFEFASPTSLTATPNLGSSFAGWQWSSKIDALPFPIVVPISDQCDPSKSTATTCVLNWNYAGSDVYNCTATFNKLPQYTVTAIAGDGCLIYPTNPQQVYQGLTTSFAVTPRTNYYLNSVSGCGGTYDMSTHTYTTGPISTNCTVSTSCGATVWLSLNLNGSGAGRVTSTSTSPPVSGGGQCPRIPGVMSCGTEYIPSTVVTLTAEAMTGMVFSGWIGGGCSGTGSCTVTMDVAKTVTATFDFIPTAWYVKAVKSGAGLGKGTVTSTPPGINCGTNCMGTFTPGTQVVLTATTSSPDVIFTGWSGGGCSGTGPCPVTISSPNDINYVTATFDPYYPLTVIKTGTGTGTVTSIPPGINCGVIGTDPYCRYLYLSNVTLNATPNSDSYFAGWSSGKCGCTPPLICGLASCQINSFGTGQTETAVFNHLPNLTINKTGTGTGTVKSQLPVMGINCGPDCFEQYADPVSVVTLTAEPDTGSVFSGWSGGGCSGTGYCDAIVDTVKTVTAIFDLLSLPSVRVARPTPIYFVTLQEAYDAAVTGETIQSKAVDFTGNLNINRDIAVTLEGGYDTNYTSRTGVTGLKGALNISAGSATIRNIIVQR